MKILKKLFFIPVLALFLMGCGGNQSEGDHHHGDHSGPEVQEDGSMQKIDKTGPEYTAAYVCPMHCEGSGSDKPGECPVCGMDYVKNED